MTSTCPNNVVTGWNKNDIGKSLKLWITSVSIEKVDLHTAIFWKNQPYQYRGKHCKTISIKKNDIFTNMVPDTFSSNITILGKVTHDDDGKDFEPKERNFIGPIWATINDQFEWYIGDKEGDTSGLSRNATLHNGLYYGILNNEQMTIGMQIKCIIIS